MAEDQKTGIDSVMEETRTFPPLPDFAEKAHINSMEQYQQMYDESINDPDKFWLKQIEILDWIKGILSGIHMQELIHILTDSRYPSKYACAKATGTCIRCGKPAKLFSDASARLEYSVSALCQCCQNGYFNEIEPSWRSSHMPIKLDRGPQNPTKERIDKGRPERERQIDSL